MTTTTDPNPQATTSGTRPWIALAVLCSALLINGVDTTILNVALPAMSDGLGAGISDLAWTIDAYTIALASLLIVAGALGDRFGRRRVFRIGLTTFAIGSVASALAPTVGWLIAARTLQGVGASMLNPVALAIVVMLFPNPSQRARAIGVWAAMFGVSLAVGPVIGGLLVDSTGWRAVFWINVPIAAVVLALTAVVVPESRVDKPRRLDVPGQVLLTVLIALLVAALIELPRVGWTTTAAMIGAVLVLAWVFVRVEHRSAEPLIDPELFRHKAFAGSVLAAALVFIALSSTLMMTSLELQEHGYTALAAGASMLPLALAATVLAPISGRLTARYGARRPLTLAGGSLTLGALALLATSPAQHTWGLMLGMLLLGTGIGLANAPITATAVSSLPAARAGVAGGTTSAARQVGAALGTAMTATIVAVLAPANAPLVAWSMVAASGLGIVALALAYGPTPVSPSSPVSR